MCTVSSLFTITYAPFPLHIVCSQILHQKLRIASVTYWEERWFRCGDLVHCYLPTFGSGWKLVIEMTTPGCRSGINCSTRALFFLQPRVVLQWLVLDLKSWKLPRLGRLIHATRDLGYWTGNTKWQKAGRYLKDTLEKSHQWGLHSEFELLSSRILPHLLPTHVG